MCGIVGSIGFIPDEIKRRAVKEAVLHRGPDGFGEIMASTAGNQNIWLAHSRLAILDLTASSNQPMCDPTGNWILVFNGEIYNFIELKKEMQNSGERFVTDSDTEVLLHGLIKYGPDFQNRCNGMWAFCLVNKRNNTVLFGRDRFGKKPLYLTKTNNGFAFASEMKALFPLMDSIQPSQDINNFFYNIFEYESTEKCVIDGIWKLKAGHYSILDNTSFKTSRWWCTLDHLVDIPVKYDDQVDQFREIFLDANRIRMRSDVRIGSALSGGLDSSCILGAMAHLNKELGAEQRQRLSGDWQNAVCCSYPGSILDEASWANLVANFLSVKLSCLEVDPLKSGWTLRDSLWQVEDPYITPPLPMLGTYREISKLGIKITLDGHGADELFSGYGHLRSAIPDASLAQIKEILEIERLAYGGFVNRGNKSALLEMLLFYIKKYPKILRDKINPRYFKDAFRDQNHPNYNKMDSLTKKMYELFHVTTLPTLLRNYDKYSMASGIEIRMPFLDHRLVSFVFSLPWTSKNGDGFTKRILRDAMKGLIPEEVRKRKDKIGWNAPVHEWFKGPLAPELSYLLSEDGGAKLEVVRQINKFKLNMNPSFEDGMELWRHVGPILWKTALFGHSKAN